MLFSSTLGCQVKQWVARCITRVFRVNRDMTGRFVQLGVVAMFMNDLDAYPSLFEESLSRSRQKGMSTG